MFAQGTVWCYVYLLDIEGYQLSTLKLMYPRGGEREGKEVESLPSPPGLASNEEKETREISRNP